MTLLALGKRHQFIEVIEPLFRNGAAARLESELVTRQGSGFSVTLGAAQA